MTSFPENEIEILHDYLPADVIELMGADLEAAEISVTGGIIGPNANLVERQ